MSAPALTCLFAAAEVSDPSFVQEVTPMAMFESLTEESHPSHAFSNFTGKVTAKKVRVRALPNLESHVIRELNRNEMIVVVGEKEGFWAIEPPSNTKAYVFRSYIIDNTVEANRVNVRLAPDTESPVIAQLNAGDRVDPKIYEKNSKWAEISAPKSTRFYIAKEFVQNVGGPEVKVQADKRRHSAEQLLDTTSLLSKAELQKPFEDINIDKLARNYQTIINDFSDLGECADQAKIALAQMQEAYLQKKIAFLEGKSEAAKTHTQTIVVQAEKPSLLPENDPLSDRMKMWEPIEEALYLNLAVVKDFRNMDEYYEDQMITSVPVTGILEPYSVPVKNKPGDFIVREKDMPVAYIYSTHVDLRKYVGKKVTIHGTPRPNNNFAFPAYFALSVE